MSPGDAKTEVIPAEQAYGEHREEMVVIVDRAQMPPEMQPEVGQQLEIRQPDGGTIPVVVTDISEADITLDANHPLAGEDLIFDIQLVEIG